MINTEEETQLRLMIFGAALLAIAIRSDTHLDEPNSVASQNAIREARGIAGVVVAEAKRLREEKPQS